MATAWDPSVIDTKQYPQNARDGLMICGIESGNPMRPTRGPREPSFFSDKDARTYQFEYTQNLIRWFRLWGHPLKEADPGDFELSIVQTNWLRSDAQSTRGRDIEKECVENWDSFEQLIRLLTPRLILLIGTTGPFGALNSSAVASQREKLLGACSLSRTLSDEVPRDPALRHFRLYLQRYTKDFRETQVIALPHPNPSSGQHPAPDYVRKFAGPVGAAIQAYRASRGM